MQLLAASFSGAQLSLIIAIAVICAVLFAQIIIQTKSNTIRFQYIPFARSIYRQRLAVRTAIRGLKREVFFRKTKNRPRRSDFK